MNEFDLIKRYFKTLDSRQADILIGMGDDAACLKIPPDKDLLVTTDTLVANVHFLDSWDPYDIAYKALMVNLSDIAAMGGSARYASLALTLPEANADWLARFSQGLKAGLETYQTVLIGGDMTKGPLSITITLHGWVSSGKAISRAGARPRDSIWVSGNLGAAALAVSDLQTSLFDSADKSVLMEKLLRPKPRLDLAAILQNVASAAIDISDGLAADLNHICEASGVGACLDFDAIPAHPLLKKHLAAKAIPFALEGGDDYELCFTLPLARESDCRKALEKAGLTCYRIGEIQETAGLRMTDKAGNITALSARGYQHF